MINKTDKIVEALKALADHQRIAILKALGKCGCCSCVEIDSEAEGLCSCDVERITGLAQPTVSHHLNLLKRAGLIRARKIGRWVYYRRDNEALKKLAAGLAEAIQS